MSARRSRLPVLKWGPLSPRDAGWGMVISLWIACLALLGVGVGILVSASQVAGAGRYAGYGIGTVFVLMGVSVLDPLLTGQNRILRLTVDQHGLRAGNRIRPDDVVLPWSQVLAVGETRKVSPRKGPTVTIGRSLEVFTRAQADPHPYVAEWVEEEPPTPDLPSSRLRFSSVSADVLDRVRAEVQQARPDLWIGEVERSWDPRPGH